MIWKLIFFISWIGIFCLSVIGIFLGVAPVYINDVLNYQYFRIILFSGSIFYLLIFLKKAYNLFERQEEKQVVLENEQGKIGMTVKSIEHVIKKMVKEKDFIKDVKVEVVPVKSAVNAMIKIEIDPIDDLNERIKEIQKLIKDYVKDVLGIEVNSLDVIVTKVHPGKNKMQLKSEVNKDE
ncbi:MAG: alkaline shock response membrane anchor protein AmaP [Fusobacteriota bacterium]